MSSYKIETWEMSGEIIWDTASEEGGVCKNVHRIAKEENLRIYGANGSLLTPILICVNFAKAKRSFTPHFCVHDLYDKYWWRSFNQTLSFLRCSRSYYPTTQCSHSCVDISWDFYFESPIFVALLYLQTFPVESGFSSALLF